jgi:MoxR-like ATPase
MIITSNEERRLPDAFLRRCIFHRIELTSELVEAAVESMARAAGENGRASFPNLDAATRAAARKRFWELREIEGLEKPPSTAELLTWLSILSAQRVDAKTLELTRWNDLPAIGALIKFAEDQKWLE